MKYAKRQIIMQSAQYEQKSSNDVNIRKSAGPLTGGQEYVENIHYSVFNLKYLSYLLTEVGFRSVRKWGP